MLNFFLVWLKKVTQTFILCNGCVWATCTVSFLFFIFLGLFFLKNSYIIVDVIVDVKKVNKWAKDKNVYFLEQISIVPVSK